MSRSAWVAPTMVASSPMQRCRKPPILAFAYISPAVSSKRRMSSIFARTSRRSRCRAASARRPRPHVRQAPTRVRPCGHRFRLYPVGRAEPPVTCGRRSITNIDVSLGPMSGGAPAPRRRARGDLEPPRPPTFMPARPSSQPGITCRCRGERERLTAVPRAVELLAVLVAHAHVLDRTCRPSSRPCPCPLEVPHHELLRTVRPWDRDLWLP